MIGQSLTLAAYSPDRLRQLAIGPQLASQVPIQVDEDDDSGGAWRTPGAPPGSPGPLKHQLD